MEYPLSVITVLPAGRKSVHKNLSLFVQQTGKNWKKPYFSSFK